VSTCWTVEDFLKESNRIEGIVCDPTAEELDMTRRFLSLRELNIVRLTDLVKVYQPDARLRATVGLNVRVGDYSPISGGPVVVRRLTGLLFKISSWGIDPWSAHLEYETLHPYTDGNGRSGRAVWLWQMRTAPIGFLHQFYYQTLRGVRKKREGST